MEQAVKDQTRQMVFLIEDDPDIAEAISDLFESAGSSLEARFGRGKPYLDR